MSARELVESKALWEKNNKTTALTLPNVLPIRRAIGLFSGDAAGWNTTGCDDVGGDLYSGRADDSVETCRRFDEIVCKWEGENMG